MNTIDEQTATELRALVAAATPAISAREGLAGGVLARLRRSRRTRRRLGACAAVAAAGVTLVAATWSGRAPYLHYEQPSAVMAPAVEAGDVVVLRRDATPQRGDVVLITVRRDVEPYEFLSRVIGLPGDVVACPDNGEGVCDAVTVSGQSLDEPWITESTAAFGAVGVGPGEVFVMGDARSAARDSRLLGVLQLRDVRGAVVARVKPDGALVRLPGTPWRALPGDSGEIDTRDRVPPARSSDGGHP